MLNIRISTRSIQKNKPRAPFRRWYEEEQGTCQEDRLHLVHVWVKVARGVHTAEVHFKSKRGETNTIEMLAVAPC